MANNRSESIRKSLYQFKILDFCVREIDLEYEESVQKEEQEQQQLFSRPQAQTQPFVIKELKAPSPEKHPSPQRGPSPLEEFPQETYQSSSSSSGPVGPPPEDIIENKPVRPQMGFNLALDLSKVANKGQTPQQKQKPLEETKTSQLEPKADKRGSVISHSEQAHPMDVSYQGQNDQSPYDSDSSSSGYDFVPPPELNPNAYVPNKKPAPFALGGAGGLGFKLNLSNVPTANQITKEDRSRIQAIEPNKPDTFNKTVKLRLSEDSENPRNRTPEISEANKTTKVSNAPPKIPAFGGGGKGLGLGLGLGFKLDLGKVPEANVITEEDKQKIKNREVPVITKNNFTDNSELKGEKPRRLNVKAKDSSTKITQNDTSLPNLKTKQGGNKFMGTKKLAKRKKEGRNIKMSKMKSLVLDNSDASSLFESGTENDDIKISNKKASMADQKPKAELEPRNLAPNMLPNNKSTSQISKASENSISKASQGSYVGSNKVFIPALNIQEDVINKEVERKHQHEEEIKHKRESDKKNPRFQMKRMPKEKKNIKNLIQAKNNKVLNNMKSTESSNPSPGIIVTNSSKEFNKGSEKKDSSSSQVNPFALNLSKVPKKGDPPRVKDNSFFEKTEEKPRWDIKAINTSENIDSKKDLVVTLGPQSNFGGDSISHIQKQSIDKQRHDTVEVLSNNELQDDFYKRERSFRGIYHDDELHALIIFLIFSLMLTPQRGTLDDLYCTRYPLTDGKPPVLHFLHYHLNHQANQPLIPIILKKVEKQFKQDSGVRLLKLLCKSLFDRNLYQESTLIAKGAYGVVYQCKTLCEDPELVAIKQMNFPASIENR